MAKTTAIKAVPMDITVVTASLDRCDPDEGLEIDAAARFSDSKSAAEYIVKEFSDLVEDFPGEVKPLTLVAVHRAIATLKPGKAKEWDAPEELPAWIKWKAFRH